jgi:hypothetical protein
MTDEQRKFLVIELGLDILEEKWNMMEGYDRNIDRSRRIASEYTLRMTGTAGLQKLLDRLYAAESTRKTRVEKI